ncbi:MAG: glycosyltransferase family 2 protein [Bacteroidales bacterium]|nr:glycosyltransferase family 2 protein [Bacteroidales bacterium]
MGFADFYFKRLKDFQVKITDKPNKNLKYIVVIPCFNEFNLIETLESLKQTKKIKDSIEVIIVINSSEISSERIKQQNIETYNETLKWVSKNETSEFRFFLLHETNLPKKFAGAGLARKIGMDQAVCRFNKIDNDKGIIVSLDADSLVKANYFVELENHFNKKPKTNAATIYFEHLLEGVEFNDEIYNAITTYELYLWYYKKSLEYTGFPYSFFTIGSAFVVNAKTYVKQGGMNRKQAGEDFYFLHKIFPLGNCFEINSTCVYPSSRISDRVPFGTGPMVKQIINLKDKPFLTYSFKSFLELKILFEQVESLFKIGKKQLEVVCGKFPVCLKEFLDINDFKLALEEINANSSNIKSFKKRFYNWFDAFRVLKYLNFAHDTSFNKKLLIEESKILLRRKDKKVDELNIYQMLELYRNLD